MKDQVFSALRQKGEPYFDLGFANEYRHGQPIATFVLDNFSQGHRVGNVDHPTDNKLFTQYEGDDTEGPDPGQSSVVDLDGQKVLKIECFPGERTEDDGSKTTTGNVYMHCLTKPSSSETKYAWEFGIDNKPWEFDFYNRIRYRVKLPLGCCQKTLNGNPSSGRQGDYYRSWEMRNENNDEAGGRHGYDYLNLGDAGGYWQTIQLDFHQSHFRGADGAEEHGVWEYPSNEPGKNYFDLLTRIYFELNGVLDDFTPPLNEFYFADFEFVRLAVTENVEQCFTMHWHHRPDLNQYSVSWLVPKDQPNTITYDVRYAFEDIHKIGWDAAMELPGSTGLVRPGMDGYNAMDFDTTDIVAPDDQEFVYMAIKASNSNLINQATIKVVRE